jgi:hypothetical protein
MRFVLTLLLLALLQACASIPRLTETDAATWGSRFDDAFACKRAGVDPRIDPTFTSSKDLETLEHNRQLWVKEVQRRKLLTPEEWALTEQKKIQIGMSVCALYASWGDPLKENKTVLPGRVHIQHVYMHHYVYSDNGRVLSWQTSR